MPSKFSSDHSKSDTQKLAKNMGICFFQIPIQDIVNAYQKSLETPLGEIRTHFGIRQESDDPVADENIQPRTRGNCLMDISNRLKDLKKWFSTLGTKQSLHLVIALFMGIWQVGLEP